MVAHVTHNLSGRAGGRCHGIAHRGAGIPSRQAVVTTPAPVRIIPIIAHHVIRSTHRCLRGIAWRRTDCAFWHALVSHPTTSSEATVTSDIRGPADCRGRVIAGRGADRTFWHAVVTIPTVSMVAHVTHNLSGGAVGSWHRIAYRGAGIPCWQAVISTPAPVHIIPIIAHNVAWSTRRRCRGVACRRADSAFRHTVVSGPAVAMHTHVTRNVCSRTF